jgi:drug/metabolite transporter (DMT)-like permease
MDSASPASTTPARTAAVAQRSDILGALWMLGAVASFTAMALSVRSLTAALSVYQVLFLRSAVGLPLLVAAVLAMRGREGLRLFRTGNLKLQAGRNVIHMFGQGAWIYGVSVLPFALVFAVEFTTPLWAVVLAIGLLRERPTRTQAIGLVLGLAGVLVIVRPGPAGLSWDLLIVFAAALAFAGTFLATRVLGRTDAPVAVPFWMCLLQTPVGLVLALLDWRPIGLAQLPAILIIAAGGLAAHQCISTALRLAPVARVLPVDYLRLPLVAIIGALFYAEPLDPFILGGGAIVLAGVLVSQVGRRA